MIMVVWRRLPAAATRAAGSCCDQEKLLASEENVAEIPLPKNVTAVIATIAMNAMSTPYRASAAPF